MVANQLDAEDLVQETFISAFKKLNQFRAEASFGSWIKKIAINKSLNFIKKKHPEFRMMDQIKESEIQTTEYLENEKGLFSIAPEKIQAEIKKLPHKARVVLNLYLLENYKHREIAEMLHISESTSKSQYLRAKELLKERLEKKIQYEI
jgi:RNA polymerase sigma-70 factor (ECF subfamily)